MMLMHQVLTFERCVSLPRSAEVKIVRGDRRIFEERFVIAFRIGSVHFKGWWFGFVWLLMARYSNLFVHGVACRILRDLVLRAWGCLIAAGCLFEPGCQRAV
jgi:hypothetical protein